MRKILVIALAVLLALAGVVSAQTESESNPKEVRYLLGFQAYCWSPPCTLHWINLDIPPPERTPDGYRISWTTKRTGWRSWKKANTERGGNAFIDGDSKSYRISGIRVPYGETLRIRIRARYNGEKNGPWFCCLEAGYGND